MWQGLTIRASHHDPENIQTTKVKADDHDPWMHVLAMVKAGDHDPWVYALIMVKTCDPGYEYLRSTRVRTTTLHPVWFVIQGQAVPNHGIFKQPD